MRFLSLCLIFIAASAFAQSFTVSKPLKDDGEVITLKLAFSADDPNYKAHECLWYSHRAGLALIHSGCDGFAREFGEGKHFIELVTNGLPAKSDVNEQRHYVLRIDVNPRVTTTHLAGPNSEAQPK